MRSLQGGLQNFSINCPFAHRSHPQPAETHKDFKATFVRDYAGLASIQNIYWQAVPRKVDLEEKLPSHLILSTLPEAARNCQKKLKTGPWTEGYTSNQRI